MSRIIDADSHFMEPLDLWERYIEPEFRARCLRFTQDPHTGTHAMLVNESKRIRGVGEFSMEDMLGVGVGYGQKEAGSGLGSFDFSSAFNNTLEDMDQRIAYLDNEGFECQFIYPTLGLMWEGQVTDPELAAAHCRAYNTWTLEVCAQHRSRLYPVGHISLRHPTQAVREIERLAKAGVRKRSLSEPCRLTARVSAVLILTRSGTPPSITTWRSVSIWSCTATIWATTGMRTADRVSCS